MGAVPLWVAVAAFVLLVLHWLSVLVLPVWLFWVAVVVAVVAVVTYFMNRGRVRTRV